MLFTLIGCILGIVLYYFISETPFIALHYMKLSSTTYGFLSLIPYIAATSALLISHYFAKGLTFKLTVKIGIFGSITFSILMLIMFESGFVNIFSLFVLTALIIAALSPSFGYAFAKAVALSKDKSLGSSTFIFIYMMLSSAIPYITKNFTKTLGVDVYPIALIAISLSLIILFILYTLNDNYYERK
jgi:hypothetical protein